MIGEAKGNDVFISCKNLDERGVQTRDSEVAAEVYRFLTAKRLSVFLSAFTLEERGAADYTREIDSALDSASVLLAIGTSVDHLNSDWVRYEWNSFANDIRSGRKPTGRIFTYIEGVPIMALPRTLRESQTIVRGEGSLDRLYNFINNALPPVAEKREREEKARLDSERLGREGNERLETEQREQERLEAEQRQREEAEARQREEKKRFETEQREKERLEAEPGENGRLEAEEREHEERKRQESHAREGRQAPKRFIDFSLLMGRLRVQVTVCALALIVGGILFAGLRPASVPKPALATPAATPTPAPTPIPTPTPDAAFYNNRGWDFYQKEDYDKAISDFSEAIRLNPNYAWAYNRRGLAYSNKKDYDKAISDYNEAIRLDPYEGDGYYWRGWAFRQLGENARAQADFDKAKQLGYTGR